MSKREYTIRLVLDDTLPPTVASGTYSDVGKETKEVEIQLNMNSRIQAPIEVAAHELGHVLGRIFKTPGFQNDPRVNTDDPHKVFVINLFGPTAEQKRGVVQSEREAWELAEKMVPIDPKGKAWALGTYERA